MPMRIDPDDPVFNENSPEFVRAAVIAAVLVLLFWSVIYYAFPELLTDQRRAPTEAEHAIAPTPLSAVDTQSNGPR